LSDRRLPDDHPRRHAQRQAAVRGAGSGRGRRRSMSEQSPLTYRDAGVDIAAGEDVVTRIAAAVESTRTREVLGGFGGFSGLYAPSYGDPALAAACDGVGTKILLGAAAGRLPGLGLDLVAMCVNDVIP